MILFLWPHCSCPNGLVTSNMAPAHPHATSVAVYPALFLSQFMRLFLTIRTDIARKFGLHYGADLWTFQFISFIYIKLYRYIFLGFFLSIIHRPNQILRKSATDSVYFKKKLLTKTDKWMKRIEDSASIDPKNGRDMWGEIMLWFFSFKASVFSISSLFLSSSVSSFHIQISSDDLGLSLCHLTVHWLGQGLFSLPSSLLF